MAVLEMIEPQTTPTTPVVASLDGVTKRYGEVLALDTLDLDVRAGEVLSLLGPNGAGKTTAVKILLGLTRPDRGVARLFGGPPWNPIRRQRMGAMLQVSKVPDTLRVGEHLDLFRSYYPAPLPMAQLVAAAGLEGLEDRPFGELSGGQQQRLMFGLALCGDPDLLVLDEPTVGLDVETRRRFWETVRRYVADGGTVLLTTHYLEEADALADRIVVLNHGRVIASGPPQEIKNRAAGRRIRCVTHLEIGVVAALAGVHTVRRDGRNLDVLASGAEQVVRTLLDLDPSLSGLEVSGIGLEDAFLALTSDDEMESRA